MRPPLILIRFWRSICNCPIIYRRAWANWRKPFWMKALHPLILFTKRPPQLRPICDNYPYNEEIEAPADDVDPVAYFLFDIKEGYCDYYATAMVMMLRSLGIPARAVSGCAEGTFDEESQVYIITEKDAHTWVEVYFPTYGWIEFEPTAGESELRRPAGEDPNSLKIQTSPDRLTAVLLPQILMIL
ncbi:MAG: transglutaminase domain-containing protein [Caldilineaceae bacterium]|nr:transglutaminase domain-containing protein [Caldilineaceae bacterium]